MLPDEASKIACLDAHCFEDLHEGSHTGKCTCKKSNVACGQNTTLVSLCSTIE